MADDSLAGASRSSGPIRRSTRSRRDLASLTSAAASPVGGGRSSLNDSSSPVLTRSGRALGRSQSAASFSPYARQTRERQPGARDFSPDVDADVLERQGTRAGKSSQQSFVGRLAGLPGRALGMLWRGSKDAGTTDRGLPQSASMSSLDSRKLSSLPQQPKRPPPHSANGSARHGDLQPLPSFPSNASLATITERGDDTTSESWAVPRLPKSRSAHSNLLVNGSVAPPQQRPSALSRTSRGTSPALSQASSSRDLRRSPSPNRLRLASSISTFNFGETTSPSRSAHVFGHATAASAASYGLQSRSPFLPRSSSVGPTSSTGSSIRRLGSPGIPRAAAGQALFPFAGSSRASSPAGRAPLPSSASSSALKRSIDDVFEPSSPARSSATGISASGSGRAATSARVSSPFARVPLSSSQTFNFVPELASRLPGSPLNPSVRGTTMSLDGTEHSREAKKQRTTAPTSSNGSVLWHPERGFVQRGELEREAADAKARAPVPKNESERLLEVLEGIGRTPFGEANRVHSTTPSIKVPEASLASSSLPASRLTTASASPYSFQKRPERHRARPGTGLESVLKARDDRRRKALEEERARQRQEKLESQDAVAEELPLRPEAATPRRSTRKRKMRSSRASSVSEADSESAADQTEATPRRKTRSMAKGDEPSTESARSKGKQRMSTRTSMRARRQLPSSPSPAPEEAAASPMQASSSTRDDPTADPVPPVAANDTMDDARPLPPSRTSGSMRPGRTHSSRTHAASSRVFSAREEDLPPVAEGDLDKVKLPSLVFPQGFTFGAAEKTAPAKNIVQSPSTSAAGMDAASSKPAATATQSSASLPSRIDQAQASSSSPSLLSRLQNGPLASTEHAGLNHDADKLHLGADQKADASFLFGSAAPAPPLSASKPLVTSTVTANGVPDFFATSRPGATPTIVSKPPQMPKLSFSHKPAEAVEATPPQSAETDASTRGEEVPSNRPNPFAMIGKPAPASTWQPLSIGGTSAPVSAPQSAPDATPVKNANTLAFSPAQDDSTPKASFVTTSAAQAQPGASQAPLFGSAPAFAKDAALAATPSKPSYSSEPSGNQAADEVQPPSQPATESVVSADEDSGMEDVAAEDVLAQPARPAVPATPAFTFGASAQQTPASSPFTFGASKADSTQPAFGGFGSAAPAPFSTSAPMSFGASPDSAFPAQPTTSAAATTSAFSFGAGSSAPSSHTPETSKPFVFGQPAAPASTSMSASLSAPGSTAMQPAGSSGAQPNGFSFSFGSASQPSTPAAGGAFQFGAPAQPGFGGAPASTAPGFNMGAGGETPKPSPGGGRRIAGLRKRRQ